MWRKLKNENNTWGFKMKIDLTYSSIDEMIACHGKPRPKRFGGGVWNAEEEFEIYKKQVGERYTLLQWSVIASYFEKKFKDKKEVKNGN